MRLVTGISIPPCTPCHVTPSLGGTGLISQVLVGKVCVPRGPFPCTLEWVKQGGESIFSSPAEGLGSPSPDGHRGPCADAMHGRLCQSGLLPGNIGGRGPLSSVPAVHGHLQDPRRWCLCFSMGMGSEARVVMGRVPLVTTYTCHFFPSPGMCLEGLKD